MIKYICIIGIFTLSSCTLHAPYKRPDLDLPTSYRLTVDETSSIVNVDWWKNFDDEVLNSLIREALQNNLDIKIAVQRVAEFYARYEIVRSSLFPHVNGTFSEYRQQSSNLVMPPVPGIPRITNNYTALLNVSYEADIWGKFRSASEASFSEYVAQDQVRRGVVLTLVSSVAATYITIRQLDAQLEIANKTVKTREGAYRIALDRFQGGITSELEVKQADSALKNALIESKRIEIEIPLQENLLSTLLGRYPDDIERGNALGALYMPPCVPVGIPSEILEQRPDIMAAEQQLIAANADVGVARANFFPHITLTGSYGNQSLELSKLFTSPGVFWQYGLEILQEIYTGGRLTGELKLAKAALGEALYIYQLTILNAFKEVNDALSSHQQTLELVKMHEAQIKVLEEYLELANLQYHNGNVDYLTVLDAQRNLFVAQLDYAKAMGDSFITLINLYKSLGGSWIY